MKNCINCDRTVNFWRLRCKVCGTRNWRAPQIAVVFLFLLAFTGGIFLLLDNMAVEANYPAASTQNNQSSPQPDPYRFKGRQRVRGTSVGRPN